ncbi:MAG TPA: hypothetical protein VLZ83_15205, partial [Edaphocola sp.]|nr:hypothetical protein [Edaphocola sp.]
MNQIGEWINNDNHFKYFLIFLFFSIKVNAQQYPLDTQLSFVNYNPPTQLPGYLTPIYDENFDTKVTRISAISEFGGIRQDLTHDYSKRQVWNSDQSLISLSYGKILDGKSYELLASAAIGSMGWSNIKPYRNYGTSSNSNYFRVYELNPQTFENRIVFTKTFSEYNRMSHWTAESNLSADDKYVALYGTKSSTGDSCWVIVYNVENDVVVSETNLNTNIANIDWVSMSQSGNYVVVLYKSRGMGVHQGTKSFDRSMNLVKHLTNTTQHGDLGYDQNGNEVWVFYDMGYLKSATLEGGEGVIQYASMQGGHVSCRNINRPGWAYVSDDGDANTPKDYPAFREIFAVKLDGKPNGVITVNRFTKHYTETNQKYNHYAKTSVSPDGRKVVFNSNMSINAVKAQNFPFAFIVEVNQSTETIIANAGDDVSICQGASTTLTATGGSTYLWSTGETTASITVSPEQTTTYT